MQYVVWIIYRTAVPTMGLERSNNQQRKGCTRAIWGTITPASALRNLENVCVTNVMKMDVQTYGGAFLFEKMSYLQIFTDEVSDWSAEWLVREGRRGEGDTREWMLAIHGFPVFLG